MKTTISAALLCAVVFANAAPAEAQSSTAQRRRDDIARVQQLVNDPDPLMRAANFEELIAENDAVKVEIAVKIALGGNDPMMRALALGAYLGANRRFTIDLSLDPALQQKLDRARQQSDEALRQVLNSATYLHPLLNTTAMRGDVTIEEFDLKSRKGKLKTNWGRAAHDFQINGNRLIARVAISGVSDNCLVELRPTRELLLTGTGACGGVGFGKLSAEGNLY